VIYTGNSFKNSNHKKTLYYDIKKRTINVSVSQGEVHSKFTWQNFNKNILETELLNLSNPEKSVVSAGKLFHILTIRMLKKLRLLELKHRCLCNIYA